MRRGAVVLLCSAPFHCRIVQPCAYGLAIALAAVTFNTPGGPPVAKVRADVVPDRDVIRAVLVEQVTGSVRWRESVQVMAAKGVTEFWEIGAGKALSGMIRKIDRSLTSRQVGTPDDVKATAAL